MNGSGRRRVTAVARVIAGVTSLAATWAAIDSLFTGVIGAGASGGPEFFLFWGLPLLVVAVFCGWYAARGGETRVRAVARRACLGAAAAGVLVGLLSLAVSTATGRDALYGAVIVVQYGPLSTCTGLLAGLALGRGRRRAP